MVSSTVVTLFSTPRRVQGVYGDSASRAAPRTEKGPTVNVAPRHGPCRAGAAGPGAFEMLFACGHVCVYSTTTQRPPLPRKPD